MNTKNNRSSMPRTAKQSTRNAKPHSPKRTNNRNAQQAKVSAWGKTGNRSSQQTKDTAPDKPNNQHPRKPNNQYPRKPKATPKPAGPSRDKFLPVSKADMEARGWEQCDFIYVCGDAYVDHSSFGMAIITRLLESKGFKVGVIAQPDWHDPASVTILGEPRLGFLVSAGNMDSMVNHYTVAKKRRHQDAYSPGNQAGLRPDRATIAYGNVIRRTYKHTPIILGGIEASLRRMAHYDYWQDKLRRSVLLDSQADLISYGMGEHSIVEIAEALDAGLPISDITYINGTAYRCKSLENVYDYQELPSYESMVANPLKYAESYNTQYANSDFFRGKRLVEPYEEDGIYVVQNPPATPLTTDEMDAVYRLPYAGTYHPDYGEAGGVPAINEVKFSLTSNRGCFGECSFCALTFHQGRIVQARSHESLIAEAKRMTAAPDFKGYIHDVGGPTANFRGPACKHQMRRGSCPNKRCLFPEPCKKLNSSHEDYLTLLRKLRTLPGVKKVFIRSGIRFDFLLASDNQKFLKELCEYHVSGQLRVAPEHVSDHVLSVMGKPDSRVYKKFVDQFYRTTKQVGKEQYVVPYLMSSHPGSGLNEAIELAEYCRDLGYMPEQVQDFYPTPSTMSTAMYFTGVDPRTMEPIYTPKTPHEKALQRALIQYRDPKNRDLVEEALRKAGRTDLIGFDAKCLIRPRKTHGGQASKGAQSHKTARGPRGPKSSRGSQGPQGPKSGQKPRNQKPKPNGGKPGQPDGRKRSGKGTGRQNNR